MTSVLRAIATVGKTDWEEAIIKACFADNEPPKEKHVLYLINMSKRNPAYDFAGTLSKFLRKPDWRIVIKALCVVHRLTREGHTNFFSLMRNYVHTLNLGAFLDQSSTEAWGQSRVVRAYGDYLAEKLYVFRSLKVSPERVNQRQCQEWVMNQPPKALLNALQAVQKQFGALLKVKLYVEQFMIHRISFYTFRLLIRDAIRLYSMINVSFFRFIEMSAQLTSNQASQIKEAYALFEQQNDLFHQWTQTLERYDLVRSQHLPDFGDLSKSSQGFTKVMDDIINKRHAKRPSGVKDIQDLVGDDLKDMKLVVNKDQKGTSKSKKKSDKLSKHKSRKQLRQEHEADHKPKEANLLALETVVPTVSNGHVKPNTDTAADLFGDPDFDPFGEDDVGGQMRSDPVVQNQPATQAAGFADDPFLSDLFGAEQSGKEKAAEKSSEFVGDDPFSCLARKASVNNRPQQPRAQQNPPVQQSADPFAALNNMQPARPYYAQQAQPGFGYQQNPQHMQHMAPPVAYTQRKLSGQFDPFADLSNPNHPPSPRKSKQTQQNKEANPFEGLGW